MALSPGQIISQRYQVIRILGSGGYGAVYLVEDTKFTGRQVALKESFDASAEAIQQFQLEANLLARLNHPALARVSDIFSDSGHQFLVMDYIEGKELTDYIRQGPVAEQQAVAWLTEICDAVAYLHSQNPPIIHRDIKPQNIKIRPDGRAVLVDFGIAKVSPRKQTAMVAKAISAGFSPIEQYVGTTDERSDVYALGATLYCAITASVPPEAIDLSDGTARLTPPRQVIPSISASAEELILCAMSLNSARRFASAREMMQALQACARGQAIALPPIAPGAPVGVRCPKCGLVNRAGAKFCQRDGIPLTGTPTPMPMPLGSVTSAKMHFERANMYFRKKNFQRAVEEYTLAAQGGFEDVALYYNWAGACIESQQISDALPVLQRGVGKYPQDAGLYALLGLAYTRTEMHPQAEQVLSRALKLDPQNIEAHLFLSLLYRVTKRHTDAITWAQKAIRLDGSIALAHFVLGQAYEAISKWNDALNAFKQAAQLDPQDPDARLHMAGCYLGMKRRSDARAELQRALKLDPQNKDAQELLKKI